MSGVLVDTNVLLDLATNDAKWADWSIHQLEAAALRGPLMINDVVYAELSVRFSEIEALDAFVAEAGLVQAETPRAASQARAAPVSRPASSSGGKPGAMPPVSTPSTAPAST